jgi:voltage-gated potassium channel
MKKLRLLWKIILRSGAQRVVTGFAGTYLACGLVVLLAEPHITRYSDALWFLWAVSTTVGLGDVTAVTVVGRVAAMLCSLYAIITTALITGVIVDYFNESRQRQFDESLTEFLDKLERLPELSNEELEAISRRVRELR